MVRVVDKHLQEVLNPNSLVLAQLKCLELLLSELVVMGRVVNQRSYNVLQHSDHLLIQRCRIGRLLDVVG